VIGNFFVVPEANQCPLVSSSAPSGLNNPPLDVRLAFKQAGCQLEFPLNSRLISDGVLGIFASYPSYCRRSTISRSKYSYSFPPLQVYKLYSELDGSWLSSVGSDARSSRKSIDISFGGFHLMLYISRHIDNVVQIQIGNLHSILPIVE
jgi:hypothetical protein